MSKSYPSLRKINEHSNKKEEPIKNGMKKQQPRQHQTRQQLSPRRNKKHTMPQRDIHQKNAGKRQSKQSPNDTFLSKSRAAALQ